MPFAFTEQGAVLSSVLGSAQAIQVNMAIVRTFAIMRQYALSHRAPAERIHDLEKRYDKKLNDVYEALNYLIQNDEGQKQQANRKQIGYK